MYIASNCIKGYIVLTFSFISLLKCLGFSNKITLIIVYLEIFFQAIICKLFAASEFAMVLHGIMYWENFFCFVAALTIFKK